MQIIIDGVNNNQVVLVKGNKDSLLKKITATCKMLGRPTKVISPATWEVDDVPHLLSKKRHIENPLVLIFMQCDDDVQRISAKIRYRQSDQAVIIIVDETDMNVSPLMESMADRYTILRRRSLVWI